MKLPHNPNKTIVPPIKCQGIKTKLVPFIMKNIAWDGSGRWIEPFLGSGVVPFNVNPQQALLCDRNPHIIAFYQGVYDGSITAGLVKKHLENEGALLAEGNRKGKDSHYYVVRERFNHSGNPLDFLFLSRACFNGMVRFNKSSKFNVPFCRKPDRFRPAYVTKIVNQVRAIKKIMYGKAWEFRVADWRDCLQEAEKSDFVYLDPPYIGRHTDYFSQWTDDEARELAIAAQSLPCGFALSMWQENRYRINDHISDCWDGNVLRTESHFYHVGPTEDLRNSVIEALVIKAGYEVPLSELSVEIPVKELQLTIPFL